MVANILVEDELANLKSDVFWSEQLLKGFVVGHPLLHPQADIAMVESDVFWGEQLLTGFVVGLVAPAS